MKIYFVRHGSTDWNEHRNSKGEKEPKCQGRADLPLNEEGIKQVKQTALALKDVEFDRVICSPLLRARQTCEIIYKGKTKIEIDNRLIERDFGEFEGLTRKEFDFFGFWNENKQQNFKSGESINDVKSRVFNLLDELKEKQKTDDNILLISHGGVGCILMSYFSGLPEDGNYLSFEIPNGKPLIIEV